MAEKFSDEDTARELARHCKQFEQAWLGNERPQIEDYISGVAASLRNELLRRLLVLEIQLTEQAGGTPEFEQFYARFPLERVQLDEVFATLLSEAGDGKTVLYDAGEHAVLHDRTSDSEHATTPNRLGRYEIRRELGRGSFGVVFLAHDPQLDRAVAVKVPLQERFRTPAEIDSFIAEARAAAKLKHPRLVAVYDVAEHDGWPYVVQEYVDGPNLRSWCNDRTPSFAEMSRVLADASEAMGYVHQNGLTHCDLKPANILMDSSGRPHIADFGLAVHESTQFLQKGQVFGTRAYMSPEQVRGEVHRFDGRTDIWALGVILYQMLSGRTPFSANDPQMLVAEIKDHDPKPLRSIDRAIPKELERICLKCLAKRRSDRYSTTDDLREDLLSWLASDVETESTTGRFHETSSEPPAGSSSQEHLSIVPKGLRSFDAEDSYFFIDLLPGPRDREGLPDSIRFWKSRLESRNPDDTFSVGLMYGPSGCGKTSLVKAGLIPRLNDFVLPVYLEATSSETETRLATKLRRRCPTLPETTNLVELISLVRQHAESWERKVVIILDQFEQWLHAHPIFEGQELVEALRHCDGVAVQCLIMVRDDFWMATSGFMKSLDLDESQNAAAVDMFNKKHARKVLIALGRAHDRLSDEQSGLSNSEELFLDRAIDGLATSDGKVASVRLAVFAQMMKGRHWTDSSLEQIGGTQGVGVAFLNEAFSSRTAHPSHRVHQRAVRRVLGELTPEQGTDIKGQMKTRSQLLEVSGYQHTSHEFDSLLEILDSEMRLITPTERLDGGSGHESTEHVRCYQLTHDFLVQPLQEWLTREQRKTRRGRAELRLIERSALWNEGQPDRHLPGVWEWINILVLTNSKAWTPRHQMMMRRARRRHSLVWGISIAVAMAIAALFIKTRTEDRVVALQVAEGRAVPFLKETLRRFPRWLVRSELQKHYEGAEGQQALSLAYGLAQFDSGNTPIEAMIAGLRSETTKAAEMSNIVTALGYSRQASLVALNNAIQEASDVKDWTAKSRLSIACWHLGDIHSAKEMLRTGDFGLNRSYDPAQRTRFIATFKEWHGELDRLATVPLDDDASLRSGVGLALGSVSRPREQDKAAWRELLTDWHNAARESGTHNATRWALERWQLELPKPEITRRPKAGCDWWRVKENVTMVRVPAGTVETELGDTLDNSNEFWICDRETTVRLFLEFMQPGEGWEGPEIWRATSQEDLSRHPVQKVSWFDAVRFCNWLSSQCDGLQPYYNIAAGSQSEVSVSTNPDANGFRLPLTSQWEYACRAGASTDYAFGDDPADLDDYGVYIQNSGERTAAVGSKLCNAWGIFDMHGNVWEWCQDDVGEEKANRGASWNDSAWLTASSNRYSNAPDARLRALGFRVVAVLSPPD